MDIQPSKWDHIVFSFQTGTREKLHSQHMCLDTDAAFESLLADVSNSIEASRRDKRVKPKTVWISEDVNVSNHFPVDISNLNRMH